MGLTAVLIAAQEEGGGQSASERSDGTRTGEDEEVLYLAVPVPDCDADGQKESACDPSLDEVGLAPARALSRS